MTYQLFLIMFLLFGLKYIFFEVCFTAFSNPSFLYEDLKAKRHSLFGYSSLYMFFVGGFVGILFYLLYLIPFMKYIPMLFLAILGGAIITGIELGVGLVLNKVLKLRIWDYSRYKFNFKGQIELFHSLGWVALSPIVFWIVDTFKYFLLNQGKLYNVLTYYMRIISDFFNMGV